MTYHFLQALLITAENYQDTVEERSIAKLCGYPICPNKLDNVSTKCFLAEVTVQLKCVIVVRSHCQQTLTWYFCVCFMEYHKPFFFLGQNSDEQRERMLSSIDQRSECSPTRPRMGMVTLFTFSHNDQKPSVIIVEILYPMKALYSGRTHFILDCLKIYHQSLTVLEK